ncbi:hypothetical protein [Hydrogenimonas sp. SS33]|uniref:hypothetical protein n=1 Tax=Hydrogenimonas leucolamina TaxID=2954236 RepID=UPI00336C29D8
MHQLEAFYESTPKAVGFVERRVEMPSHTVQLYGPPRSGKTWLVLDHLSRVPRRKRLYVDLRDLRVDKEELARSLNPFIHAQKIETVVLDHYDGSVPLPSCRQLVVVCEKGEPVRPLMPLLELKSLDFEEYLAFERRHIHLEHSFSLYLRTGSLPQMAQVHETLLTMALQEAVRSIFPRENERSLFRHLARHLGKQVTAYQLYTLMKKEGKISKDWLYRTLKSWEERGIVQWIEKMDHPRAARRLLIYDFAMPASLYFEKSLMGQLLSLAGSHLLETSRDIYFSDHLDFLLPDEHRAILVSPFSNHQIAAQKVAAAAEEIDRYAVRRITILTIANRFEFTFEKKPVRAVPFYEWIMGE